MGETDGDGKKSGVGGVSQDPWPEWEPGQPLPRDMVFNHGHVVTISIYSVLMIVSAIGNLTVLYLLIKRKMVGRASRLDFLLMNLAIADLLVTFLMMPLEIGWAATVYWKAGDFMCRVMMFTRTFGLYLSSFVLVCISLDRYYAVLHPLCVSGERRARLALFGAWFAAFLSSLPQTYIFSLGTHPNLKTYTQCVSYGSLEPIILERAYFAFNLVLMYLFPMAATVLCYSSVLLEIKKRSCLDDPKVRRNGIGVFGRARVRTLKMTVTIVLVFFVCWTPYYVMCFWYEIDQASAKSVNPAVQRAMFLFACTNSCANPIVYGIFNLRETQRPRYSISGSASGFQRHPSKLSYGDSMELPAAELARARDSLRAHAQAQLQAQAKLQLKN